MGTITCEIHLQCLAKNPSHKWLQYDLQYTPCHAETCIKFDQIEINGITSDALPSFLLPFFML